MLEHLPRLGHNPQQALTLDIAGEDAIPMRDHDQLWFDRPSSTTRATNVMEAEMKFLPNDTYVVDTWIMNIPWTDASFLANINTSTGILFAVVGTLLSMDAGVPRKIWSCFLERIASARAYLARFIPALRDKNVRVATGAASSGSTLTSNAFGESTWIETATIEEKIEELRRRESRTRGELIDLSLRVTREHLEIRAELARVESRLEEGQSRIRALIHSQHENTVELNALSLPLIAAGIVVSALTELIALFPIITWSLLAIGVWCSTSLLIQKWHKKSSP